MINKSPPSGRPTAKLQNLLGTSSKEFSHWGTYRDGDQWVDSLFAVAVAEVVLALVVTLAVPSTLAELADSTLAMLSLELDAAAAASAEKADVNMAVPYMLLQ
jgi:hypothetical protein